MTFKELKQFCDSLNELQLEKEVILFREEYGVKNINAETFGEDQYIDPNDEEGGFFPESSVSDKEELEGYKKVWDKDDPMLWEKF